jgi:predicted MFS family arabinose efflux permease
MISDAKAWRAVGAATAGVSVSIGLARFAYAPLLPVLIAAGWFSPGDAAYLGAANLAGYLIGAAFGRNAAARLGLRPVARGMMLAVTLSLAGCAWPFPFSWFFLCRLVSGVGGGALMVLGAPAALSLMAPERRGLAAGVIFTGVGVGIAFSGTVLPLLLRLGLTPSWLALAAVSLVLTLLVWRGWPATLPPIPAGAIAPPSPRLRALYLSYGLCAFGLVPHMVFLVDYAVRGLGQGIDAGAGDWILFGIGAACGPVLAGRLADRVGFGAALRLLMLADAVFVAALAWVSSTWLLAASALLVGATVPAVSAVALGRVHELAGTDPRARLAGWSRATIAWALGQAVAAYGFAFIYARTGHYGLMFTLAAAAIGVAFLIEAASAMRADTDTVRETAAR